jgi:uncharacterized phage protein (TIGR01671 family)
MREIKFRAFWNKKMHQVESVLSGGRCALLTTGQTHRNVCVDNNMALMQYTGLKDKNGKEIYEGDICKIVVDDTTDDYSISTVKFHDGAFTVDADFGEYDTSAIGWAITDCENGGGYIQVLGNIHENPELMEVK